jgi:hypothetical protein
MRYIGKVDGRDFSETRVTVVPLHFLAHDLFTLSRFTYLSHYLSLLVHFRAALLTSCS